MQFLNLSYIAFFYNVQYIIWISYVVRCAIWYYSYNLKNVKNTYGGVLLLVKLQAAAY